MDKAVAMVISIATLLNSRIKKEEYYFFQE